MLKYTFKFKFYKIKDQNKKFPFFLNKKLLPNYHTELIKFSFKTLNTTLIEQYIAGYFS